MRVIIISCSSWVMQIMVIVIVIAREYVIVTKSNSTCEGIWVGRECGWVDCTGDPPALGLGLFEDAVSVATAELVLVQEGKMMKTVMTVCRCWC